LHSTQLASEHVTHVSLEVEVSVTNPAEHASQTNPSLQVTQFARVEHALHVVGEAVGKAYAVMQLRQTVVSQVEQPVPYYAAQFIVH
jgi:hypothetical protein